MSEKKKEEAEMMNGRNYDVLAQIYTILNDKMSKKSIAIRKVLQKDFDINYSVPKSKCSLPNIVGRTALDFALEKRELEIFKMLISHGADFTDKNQSGSTILHRIIEKSYVKSKECYKLKGKLQHPFVDAVLSAHVESKNITNPINEDGISHFHIACMFNHVEAVQFFLAQGVSVIEAISQDSKIFPGSTPLHLAARYSAFETAKLLLEYNADVNLRDARGLYPLFLLIQRNNEILDMKNVQKKSLCEKLKYEHSTNENMIKILLEKSKNNVEGLSRCHVACTLQDTKVLEDILTEGVNLKDSVSENSSLWPGHTALHFAALFNINAVKLLVANGADIMTKDANGVTPFNLCLQRYPPRAIHSLMTAVPELNKITFCNRQTKVADFIFAMSEVDTLRSFLQETAENANMSVPSDSPLWPGYTILHIAVVLSDRIHDNRDLYVDTDYEPVQSTYRYYKDCECYQKIKLCLRKGADVTVGDIYSTTPLHLAFQLQNRDIVKLLVEYHHEVVNIVNSDGLSHLHIACTIGGRNELIEKLLENGIDVNRPIMSNFVYRLPDGGVFHINPGWTCLHIAVAIADDVLAELLIKYNADLYAKDSYEMTPIHQAFQADCVVHICNGLSQKHYEDRVTSFGLSHLHVACFAGNIKSVEGLLRNGANIEETINYSLIRSTEALSALAPFDGYTPVHFALRERHFKIVELLVQHGVNILAKSADGSIPLYEAFKIPFNGDDYFSDDDDYYEDSIDYDDYDDYNDTYECTFAQKLLSVKRIEEIIQKDSGITKLHIACFQISRRIVNKLLANGADPNAQIHENSPIWPGFTPLHVLMAPRFTGNDGSDDSCSLYQGIEKIGESLLKHGASVLLKDVEGNTPIHKAPELLWSDSKLQVDGCYLVGWILEGHKDFSVNPVDAYGISHFDIACMCAQNKVLEKFLQHGVDVNRQFGHFSNRYGGFTALHLASLYKDESKVHLLVKHGASYHIEDFLGNTPFHTAAVYCRLGNNGCRPYNELIYLVLLDAGADVEVKNLWDETPLEVILRMDLLTSDTIWHLQEKHPCCINVFNLESEEGCLGIALRFRSSYRRIEDESFCKTIINHPSLNDTDKMGRTVIHNVVSVKKLEKPHKCYKNGSIEDYTRIIHEFIKLEFDVDCQDNRGQTALHTAVLFGNYNAIIGLLMNGADINVADDNNKLAISYAIDRREEDRDIRRSILEAFLLHAYKLQIAGLEISRANQNVVERISKESITCYSEMQRCSKELENLKNHVISNSYSVTLYNFLAETMLYFRMMLILRDDIDKIFITNISSLREMYPQFVGLLQMQYRNIFIREQLIDPAKSALNFLAELPLPELCSERIIKLLKNRDLKQLIAAAQLA